MLFLSAPLKTAVKTGLLCKKKALGSYSFENKVRQSKIKNSTLLIPVQRIGSKTNSFKGKIYSISIS